MFELDVTEASDGVWVCRHGWTAPRGQWKKNEKRVLTSEEFLAAPLWGKYTPMTLEDFFVLLKDYPDAYVLLDSKKYQERDYENSERDFSAFVEIARKAGCENVLGRIIPEIYNEEMYEGASAVYQFPAYIYSIVEEPSLEELRDIALFCGENNIQAADVSEEYWSEEVQAIFDEQKVSLYAYTVNDPARAEELLLSGAAGGCSDSLLATDLRDVLTSRK